MSDIEADMAAYQSCRVALEAAHKGKWVVFHDKELTGIYDDFERAAEEAVKRFGSGPYLIRQIGAPDFVLPASVMYRLA